MPASGVAPLAVTIALMLATVLLVGVGERIAVPYPVLVLLLGGALAIAPGIPTPNINPDLILPIFLPPLVFAAVRRSSWPMVWARRKTIVSLAVLLVVATIAAVAGTVRLLLPELSLAAALALGALLSPPDPVAAEAVAGRIRLPRRLETILATEGLCNDATALVVYGIAVSALVSGHLSWPHLLLSFCYEIAAAIVIGMAIAVVARWLLVRIANPNARSGLTLVVPFGTYLVANAAKASGVLAVLAVGLMLGSTEAQDTGVTDRLIGGAFWDTLELLVTGIAFGLMGLELRAALDQSPGLPKIIGHLAVICLVVVFTRFAWMLAAGPVSRRLASDVDDAPHNWREDVVLAWAGMRGLATIAPALALPQNVPHRGELLFTAFAVIVVTLVLPGLTLPSVTAWLGVKAGADADAEALRPLAKRASQAALRRLRQVDAEQDLPSDVTDGARIMHRSLVYALTGEDAPPGYRERLTEAAQAVQTARSLRQEMLAAARREIVTARREPGTDPKAVDELLRRLDLQSARFEL